MKTRDEQLANLRDELRGLVMESFAQTRLLFALSDAELAKFGRTMHVQLHRTEELFERIVATVKGEPVVEPPKPAPVQAPKQNGVFSQAARKPNGS